MANIVILLNTNNNSGIFFINFLSATFYIPLKRQHQRISLINGVKKFLYKNTIFEKNLKKKLYLHYLYIKVSKTGIEIAKK